MYLSEYSISSRTFAYFLRLFNDVLTGIPSIVIGITGYIAHCINPWLIFNPVQEPLFYL